MRIVAVLAVIASPAAARQIPVSVHAAVRTVLIIAELRAVTLRTQRHRIGVVELRAIRQMQLRVTARILMARHTSQLPVLELQPLMKLIQLVTSRCLPIGNPNGMAR